MNSAARKLNVDRPAKPLRFFSAPLLRKQITFPPNRRLAANQEAAALRGVDGDDEAREQAVADEPRFARKHLPGVNAGFYGGDALRSELHVGVKFAQRAGIEAERGDAELLRLVAGHDPLER